MLSILSRDSDCTGLIIDCRQFCMIYGGICWAFEMMFCMNCVYESNLYVIYLQDGKTALHVAVEKGHEAIATILLQNQADVNAADKVCGT